jgi:signal transduction histidine kinase/CheY-like chemotaxis protein
MMLIAFIAYFMLKKLVIRPMKKLTIALQSKNSYNLASLNQAHTEYGELSRLITNFFDQNLILGEEIESRRKSEAKLQMALKEKELADIEKIRAEQAALAKSQFLSTMSHEIRTPINGVIGISNLLMDENLTPRQTEYVRTLNFSAQNLLSIVSDILDFSKIESGKIEFEKSSFNLEHVCYNVFKLFEQKAQEKGISYEFKPATASNFSYYGDHFRLSQVLSNLLSNAVKFTETGGVQFSYAIEKDNADSISVAFTVKDSGIGLTPEQQGRIFESFSQADKHITARYGGTGLGLTISKKLIELQQGHISLVSEHGKGSVFTVRLKYDKHSFADTERVHSLNTDTKGEKQLDGFKILVAEDNQVNAMVLTRFLKKWKIESKVAVDGVEAISMLNKEKFDLILMDLQMPNMDGHEAMRTIRESEDEEIKNMTVIAFTADALLETQKKLINNGFDNCMTKPFSPDALFKLLAKYYTKAKAA